MAQHPFSLEGKIALVTGANTGLGQGIALALAAAGGVIAADYVAKPALYPDDDFIVAIAPNAPQQLPEATLRPVLDLDSPDAVAEWLVQNGERFAYSFDMH